MHITGGKNLFCSLLLALPYVSFMLGCELSLCSSNQQKWTCRRLDSVTYELHSCGELLYWCFLYRSRVAVLSRFLNVMLQKWNTKTWYLNTRQLKQVTIKSYWLINSLLKLYHIKSVLGPESLMWHVGSFPFAPNNYLEAMCYVWHSST